MADAVFSACRLWWCHKNIQSCLHNNCPFRHVDMYLTLSVQRIQSALLLCFLLFSLSLAWSIGLFQPRFPADWNSTLSPSQGVNLLLIVLARLRVVLNPLKPNDPYRCRNAPLTSKRCILYIYSANIGTEYFKHSIYSPYFLLQNAVCFIILTYLVPVLFTFYIQGVLKLKKIIIPAPKG